MSFQLKKWKKLVNLLPLLRRFIGRAPVDVLTSVRGLAACDQGQAGPLNGNWYDYAFKPIPW